MKALLRRSAFFSAGLWLLIPGALWAHQGHAGDHGWLAGALQPLLSVDHFLAALFVFLVGVGGLTYLARWKADTGRTCGAVGQQPTPCVREGARR